MKCANCPNDVTWSGRGRKPKYCSDACKQEAFRNRKASIRNKWLREQRSKLYIVPLSLEQANTFVSQHHRHNKPVVRAKFYIGVIDEAGLLRGVAIVGRPVARLLDDGLTLEVNRVATDGVPNGCSALYAASRKIAFEMGYQRLVTYTLPDEGGFSLRGAGWKRVSEIRGHAQGWQNRIGRERQEIATVNKWRWETVNPACKNRPTFIIPEKSLTDNVQLVLLTE